MFSKHMCSIINCKFSVQLESYDDPVFRLGPYNYQFFLLAQNNLCHSEFDQNDKKKSTSQKSKPVKDGASKKASKVKAAKKSSASTSMSRSKSGDKPSAKKSAAK